MFYSYAILAKKGPLAKIWLAAHWNKKLTKSSVFQTDIEESCANIRNPSVPLALRVSGHLLLGVVQVYSRKVNYLFVDCNDALVKIKNAFRTGDVNLAEDTAGAAAINVAGFGDFDNIAMMDEFDDMQDSALPVVDDAQWMRLATQGTANPAELRFEDNRSVTSGLAGDEEEELVVGLETPMQGGASTASYGPTPDLQLRRDDTPATPGGSANLMALQDEELYAYEAPLDAPGADDAWGNRKSEGGARLSELDTPMGMKMDFDAEMAPDLDVSMGGQQHHTDLITQEDLAQQEPAENAPVSKRSKKRREPTVTVDESTQLPQRQFKRWAENSAQTMLPCNSTAKRMRSLREERERVWDEALGRKHRSVLERCHMFTSCNEKLAAMWETNFADKFAKSLKDVDQEALAQLHVRQLNQPGDNEGPDFGYEAPLDAPDFGDFGADQQQEDEEEEDEEQQAGAAGAQAGEEKEDMIAAMEAGQHLVDDEGEQQAGDMAMGVDLEGNSQDEELTDTRAPGGRWNTRTKRVMLTIGNCLKTQEDVTYASIATGNSRHTVAGSFLELLVLKSWDYVEVNQEDAYGDITISKAPEFDETYEGLRAEVVA